MRTSAGRGRIYRRCGCRDTHRHQIGARCPHLATDSTHGTCGFAVDVPAPDHRRTTVRRGGFTTQDAADEALRQFLEGEGGGFDADSNQTVAAYLNTWPAAKALVLKPTTMAATATTSATTSSPRSAPSSSTSSPTGISRPSSPASSPAAAAGPPSTGASPPCPARSATPSASTASPTTQPLPRCCTGRRRRNDGSGQRRKQPDSSPAAIRPTPRWPTSTKSSSAPACARAKPSACTGTTSTSTRACSTSAAHSPPSTTTAPSSCDRPSPSGTSRRRCPGPGHRRLLRHPPQPDRPGR